MNILFAIAEAAPFVKMGGLGDIGGSLPGALQNSKTKVRVILPKYSTIPERYRSQMQTISSFVVELAWRRIPCTIEQLEWEGVTYLFVGNDHYFHREGLYGYEDDGERFAFFSKAVLECLTYVDFQPNLIHCHDWHTALIPLMLQENYSYHPYYYGIKTILTIHNLKHQGQFPLSYFTDLLGYQGHAKAWQKLEYYGALNYMKSGILTANLVTTVSPTYAYEIQTSFYGEGLDGVLRHRRMDLYGILNGIDTKKFDPATDPAIFVNYRSSMTKKAENKTKLQEKLALPVNKDLPMLGMISRLVTQKGLDLLEAVLDEVLQMEVQLVILGAGEKKYEDTLRFFAERYPQKMALCLGYDEDLSRQIYAGSDLFLMPSQFEPCGLSQMIAMGYGTLPIVRETGGLRDTVSPYNEYTGEGNGFGFANYNAHELLFTVQRAVRLYAEEKDRWKALVQNALKADFRWENSAQKYLERYRELIE